MKRPDQDLDFEVEVDSDGGARIGPELLRRLGVSTGSKLHIRLVARWPGKSLTRRGVTEEEIDRIARLQFEDRENVIRFLSSEGRLAKNRGFRRRAKGLFH